MRFEKVSFEQFKKDYMLLNNIENLEGKELESLEKTYDKIKLPARATSGSAGYDFFSPFFFYVISGDSIKFPTGIRCKMDEGWCLLLFIRSSLGLKYRFQLDNNVAVIDSDFYYSDNEGHIMAKFTNDSREGKAMSIAPGAAYMQGVFVQFGLTEDDNATGVRNGGIGSTDGRRDTL